ncbi:GRIP and coiled-coil domain-containing protein 2 [Xyrauchen texanus]|uniref:GRIP and coiled-coil domain-containing protein 2 n=1 Tax=Xyrauchen texanus TaxID=154827 RepID=UPI00224297F5|nr:GRIP and coiled-coil domain-containing protein 2 [Xyrauchen texanus]
MEETNPESVMSPLGQATGKSKLDTLSKEDLIKFAKKQMVAMQKMKSKCADLEKEVAVFKLAPQAPSDDSIIQELTERMDAVLLEKAETQQSLMLLRKEHEELKKQAQDTIESLAALKAQLETKNKECAEMQKHTTELTATFEATCHDYQSKISQIQKELEEAKYQLTTEIETLKDSHQSSLTESQQEIENLQQEMERLSKQYEDDVRDLEEQLELNAAAFERERERLLLLQEELTEQLSLKEGFLQDVQEEEEDASRAGALKDSGSSNISDFPASDDSSDEAGMLKMALEDLQSHNVMLQEELTFLRNVKLELESELKQVRDEFSLEKDDLEFRINELQMNKDDGDTSVDKSGKRYSISEVQHYQEVQTFEEPKESEACLTSSAETQTEEDIPHVDNLQNRCRPPAEVFKHTKNIQTNEEMDLQDITEQFIKQYKTMKEQTTVSVEALQEKLQNVFQQRDDLLEQLLKAEETVEPVEQKMSFEDLKKENKEILVHLQHKEALILEFMEILKFVDKTHEESKSEHVDNALLLITAEKDEQIKTLKEEVSFFQTREEECQENNRLLKFQILSLSEERDTLQNNMDACREQLSEILEQNFSKTEAHGTADILTLINHLLTKAQEEKAILIRQFDERVEQFTVELESVRQLGEEQSAELQAHIDDLNREKDLLKTNLGDVVLDTEGLQKDLSEMQVMNEKLGVENQGLINQVADLSRSLNEKLGVENQGLINQVADLSRSLEEKQQEEKCRSEEIDALADEMKELQQRISDRDALISQLKDEIGLLQMSKESPVSKENDNMKDLSDKIEILEKESKDKDERMNKIKAVAVKAKKELDNSKKEVVTLREEVDMLKADRDKLSRSMKDIIHGAEDYKNLMVDYDKQTELLDKEKEKLEQVEKHNEDLTKRLQNAIQQHELLSSEREDLTARLEMLQSNVTQLESQIVDMQRVKCGLEKELEAEKLLREQKFKEHQCVVREMEELQAQLSKHKHQLQQTAQELEQLRKDAQQNSLMDMEMADYEKLVKELNHKLSERDRQIEEHQTQAQTHKQREQRLNEEIESLKSLVDQTEDKASRMKQLLIKTKKDLGDAKQKEAAQMITQASLRGELEAHQQQLEEYKIQCSELTAERHRLQEQLKIINDQQQRVSSSYQLSLNTLQDECNNAKADLAATVSEFESYKVRVHNVLKQQKHKSSNQTDGDAVKSEREHIEAVMQQLHTRLQETQHNLQSSTAELQQLHTEHDMLLERHNKFLQETVSKEAELRERLLSLQSENVALKSEHGQCMSQLTARTEALRSSFREQTRHLQDEHCSTVETLQQQINRLEAQLYQLQRETSNTAPVLVQQHRKSQSDRKLAEVPQFDLQGTAREEGEGMETTEIESVSSPGTSLASLEQLLSSPDLKHEPVVWQVEPSKEELIQKLNTATRSMEHLNSLLHETEATNAVLMEQITLLKSELRRLERNQEREKSVANLEYLKNVLLQFIFLRSGSERQALLPVIHTMLQLSPEEKSKLAAIAQGEEESSAGSRGSGWTSYLHSWSGIR